ncbi:MAG: hypothetical protein J0M30_14450 [Chitinophagales bacterium]|nr:hypothetical protein [Chitinophagales bacterium]
MIEYLNFVESLARHGGTDQVFFNSGPNHAAIVMANIFRFAKSEVNIYCGGFSGEVSNDHRYLRELENYLERGGRVVILVEQDLSKNGSSKIYNVLRKYKEKVDIYLSQGQVTDTRNGNPVHITIADGRMYRLETGIHDYTAEVNFNNPERVALFASFINQLMEDSRDFKINLAA